MLLPVIHRSPLPLLMLLGAAALLPAPQASGSWTAPTGGQPAVEITPAKDLGHNGSKNCIAEDELGRVFIGADKLLVFDGQNWLSYALPQASSINDLALGRDGKIWVGAVNELGYFQENPADVFVYHSLLPQVPEAARDVGTVWGCAPVGDVVYFICQKKILRWDGQTMQVIPMDTKTRLSPLKLQRELWVHHLETGLHRLSAQGPQLEIPARHLPDILIIGLFRDETGLVTVSNQGFTRPGQAGMPFSEPALNQHLSQHRVSAFRELPDGHLAIGTLSGGLVLATRQGSLLQAWTSAQGLPGRAIYGLNVDRAGNILSTTSTDFFHFPSSGHVTLFNSHRGLPGAAINSLSVWRDQLYAATEDGSYSLKPGSSAHAAFTPITALTEKYYHILPRATGLVLARFGGADYFDGANVSSLYRTPANWTTSLLASRRDPQQIFTAEATGLGRLRGNSASAWDYAHLIDLPDPPNSLHEDSAGRLWVGTATRGAFRFDPATRELSAVQDPLTQHPFVGKVLVAGSSERLLFFSNGQAFEADADGHNLRILPNVPAFDAQVAQLLPNGADVLIAWQRSRGADAQTTGLGVLFFDAKGTAHWRDLDLPEADLIGTVRTLTFAEEAGHQDVLWIGGTTGVLRADYARIPTLQPPPIPTIRLGNPTQEFTESHGSPTFKFEGHRVKFAVFSGSYVAGKQWLLQTRLQGGEWSGLSPRRSFEFTNLSEGVYHFEVRVVNPANMASQPAAFTFTILPPWYRSGQAYALYSVGLLVLFFSFIRVKERRIRARNQQLESLVAVRTQELVKANAAKDEFLASISHEIRNPMNGVIGIAESIDTAPLDDAGRHKFGLLRQCASHLSSLLEDILDFSRVQAGGVDFESRPFDVRELVQAITAMTASDSEKRGIPVEVAVSPAVPERIIGDPRRIRQILLNFVSNALKFSGRGQVSVTVWSKPASAGRTEIIFAISDEGPGISEEEQQRLFTRFERGAAAQKGRVPGTGLGLALCKQLAEKMGGRIWMESELGRGSCFYFSAPFPTESPAPASAPADNLAPRLPFKSALVVDDEEYNRIALADLLDTEGIAVQTAGDGLQALAFAELQDYDVIFLDYDLPGLNGLEIARAVRALPTPSSRAVILATTAFNSSDKQAACLAAGMNAFITKPVTKERLQRVLAQSPATSSSAVISPQPKPDSSRARQTSPAEPADRLANLRLLARKKQVPFAQELALFLSELDVEFTHLDAAILEENTPQTGHYAHLLYGRLAFIYERELERTLRSLEAAAATSQWSETRRLFDHAKTQMAELRVRVTADAPAVPPGSGR